MNTFQNSLKRLSIAICKGYMISVDIKRLNTGSYKYLAKASYTPGQHLIYEVFKFDMSEKLIANVTVDVSNHEITYNNSELKIPDSISKALREFNREIYYYKVDIDN